MREPLRVAVAQPLCVPYDVGQNAVAHAAVVRAAAARVVVFPELSLTGYELEAPALTAQSSNARRRCGDIVTPKGNWFAGVTYANFAPGASLRAASTFSRRLPPRKKSGLSRPSTRFASVTVGSRPPRG